MPHRRTMNAMLRVLASGWIFASFVPGTIRCVVCCLAAKLMCPPPRNATICHIQKHVGVCHRCCSAAISTAGTSSACLCTVCSTMRKKSTSCLSSIAGSCFLVPSGSRAALHTAGGRQRASVGRGYRYQQPSPPPPRTTATGEHKHEVPLHDLDYVGAGSRSKTSNGKQHGNMSPLAAIDRTLFSEQLYRQASSY